MVILHSTSAGELRPDSPSIVLVHGLFGSSDNLAVIRRHFESQYHVLSVDLPDHGRSQRFNSWSFETAAKSLIQTIEDAGIKQCYLIGHSLGGKVSMLAAHYAPQLVQKLVVLDIAPVTYESHHQNVMKGLDNVDLSGLSNRKQASNLLAEHVIDLGTIAFLMKSLYQDENKHWHWRFNLSMIQRDYDKMTAWPFSGQMFNGDTTFIKGANSDYIIADYQAVILEQFPKAKAKIVPAGHWLHAEKTQLVNTLLTRILRGNDN